jgi:FHA domain
MLPSQNVDDTPHLVVTSSGPLQGSAVDLLGPRLIVGRGEHSDIRVEDPFVSRSHALIERSAGRTFVTDLGSLGGTTVNGTVARSPVELHDGDVVCFATVCTRYEVGRRGANATMTIPVVPAGAGRESPTPVTHVDFTTERQSADQLNNVAGNQYNQYLQQVNAARASFVREVAASRTRARRMIWLGLLLFLGGGGTYTWAILRAASEIDGATSDTSFGSGLPELFGPKVGGVPIGLIGFAVAFVGLVMMLVGLVLHVVATSRQRRYDTTPPLAPVPAWPLVPPQ